MKKQIPTDTKHSPRSPTYRAWIKQGKVCCYCEDLLPYNKITCEHLVRQSDGGKRTLDNVAASCYDCNVNRGGIDWATYKSYVLGELYA